MWQEAVTKSRLSSKNRLKSSYVFNLNFHGLHLTLDLFVADFSVCFVNFKDKYYYLFCVTS